ncbi:autotransporter outer membrane beta-barrel domain-containing protein, partial [Salmonella enterica]|nr:autotransporter outer membrane beta-barrel domain-containing protein [Salmonella enterica]EIH3858731.1 autotransporter outer membrane beta-barrel domain-containing protein [Salmonella enterica]
MKEESPRGKVAIILTVLIMTSANPAVATEITHIEEEGTGIRITDTTIDNSHLILIHGNEKHLPLTTELLLNFHKGSVQHTDKAQGPHNTTIEKSRVTGELTLMRPRIDLDRTDTNFKDSVINKLIIESHNAVTVDKDSLITDVLAGTQGKIDETVEVTNNGDIKGLSGVGILNNSGTVTLTGDVGDITNSAEGTIRATDHNQQPALVTNLINDGKIELNYSGLVTPPDNSAAEKLTNNGSITMKSGWMGVGNGRTLENNGDIKLSNEQGERESLIILYVSNNSSTSKIVNYGRIQGDPAAIIAYDEDPLSTPDRMGHINNNGIIEGGIYTERDTGDRKPLEVSNGINGYWSSRFDEVELHDTKLYVESKYYSITNDGHISTIQRPDGQPGKIETNKFSNNGVIDIQNGPLVIDGEYQAGTGARLVTGGAMGGDETQLPTLTVHGRVTGETTHVRVDNMGGAGAATTDGILVVRADTVDGEGFTKGGRIVAGAYEYDLVRIESGDHTEWRLTSALTPVPPGPVPPVPPGPEPGPEPVPPVPPAPVHVVRPEAVTYAENLRQANTLFMTDSEQRRAVGEYTDPVTGRTETSSLWLSQTGGHSARHDASGQLNSDYNRYTVQLGGTLLSLPAGDDGRLEAGVQAGYGHARGNTRSGLTGYRARGTVSGYSTG